MALRTFVTFVTSAALFATASVLGSAALFAAVLASRPTQPSDLALDNFAMAGYLAVVYALFPALGFAGVTFIAPPWRRAPIWLRIVLTVLFGIVNFAIMLTGLYILLTFWLPVGHGFLGSTIRLVAPGAFLGVIAIGTTALFGPRRPRPDSSERTEQLSSNTLPLMFLLSLMLHTACAVPDPFEKPRPIAAIVHHGFRADIPESQRGNGVFETAWWSEDDRFIVTRHHMQQELRVWDAHDGALLSRINGYPEEDVWIGDGPSGRLVVRVNGCGGVTDYAKLVVNDLTSGRTVTEIPDDPKQPGRALGLIEAGRALVVARGGGLEIWQLEPARLLRSTNGPIDPGYQLMIFGAVGLSGYNDKQRWEISPSGRYLALGTHDANGALSTFHYFLVDLDDLQLRRIAPPDATPRSEVSSFAFSHDERLLACGRHDGVWLYGIESGRWGPFVAGQHKRNNVLAPITFRPDGARLVAFGDQLQTTVIDPREGSVLGRWDPAFEDWEGVFRASRDGSRVVAYHFVSDTLEVIDGHDARPIGYVCPFFCNKLHNPVEVHYAISPDGSRVVASHRFGAGIFESDTDRLIAPLEDPLLPLQRERTTPVRAGAEPKTKKPAQIGEE